MSILFQKVTNFLHWLDENGGKSILLLNSTYIKKLIAYYTYHIFISIM